MFIIQKKKICVNILFQLKQNKYLAKKLYKKLTKIKTRNERKEGKGQYYKQFRFDRISPLIKKKS